MHKNKFIIYSNFYYNIKLFEQSCVLKQVL